MITVTKSNNIILFEGHSFPDICAACSSVMYTTVNAILKYDESSLQYEDNDEQDYVKLTILKYDDIINMLVCNMIDMLCDIKEENDSEIEINII